MQKAVEAAVRLPDSLKAKRARAENLKQRTVTGTCFLVHGTENKLPCPNIQFVVESVKGDISLVRTGADGIFQLQLPDEQVRHLRPQSKLYQLEPEQPVSVRDGESVTVYVKMKSVH